MPDQVVQLRDGRALGYREFGDPAGRPVVSCHGGLVCGLDVGAYAAAARDLGVRIVSPDRPGIGASDNGPGRTTRDWADDFADLLDALGIDRAAVLGWSMGGQYALACAAVQPDRVTRTAVIAGALPLDDPDTFAELNAMDRRFTRLAEHHPHVAKDLFATLGRVATDAPQVWVHLTARSAVAEEATAIDALADPSFADAAVPALAHGEGMVEEYRAWVRPWGFEPEAVVGPVTIWQGGADELVPAKWAEELARRIPDARLHLLPGEGHFLGFRHQSEILRDLNA